MQHTEENELINDENVAPLTKTKTKGRPKKVCGDDAVGEELPPIPPKTKKPRSDKQVEAFAKAQEKVKANRAKKLEDKKIEASKLLLEKGIELPSKQTIEKIALPPVEKENDEVEIVHVKKHKPKPKKKKIIVYHDNSSSEEEESSEEEQEIHIKKTKHFKSQQNKKSVIKVGGESVTGVQRNTTPPQSAVQKNNFFCD